ncbi:hypothetical protein J41TS4_32490 [Paenibacillus apis]|uniref:Uncharacterized protein n=1 Tax=Paenibacillus apis TaxID=1792174 RepID=A0A919Y265_9BACL|nr:hypothetical protein J41TS4_32490 [Paenibacillus apis]
MLTIAVARGFLDCINPSRVEIRSQRRTLRFCTNLHTYTLIAQARLYNAKCTALSMTQIHSNSK